MWRNDLKCKYIYIYIVPSDKFSTYRVDQYVCTDVLLPSILLLEGRIYWKSKIQCTMHAKCIEQIASNSLKVSIDLLTYIELIEI